MIRFKASSRQYEEEFDNLVDSLVDGDTWHAALITFGTFGPITGDVGTNRRKIENDHRIAPFASLLPVQLVTPEGLPFFTGSDEDTRFDLDLVTWEQRSSNSGFGLCPLRCTRSQPATHCQPGTP
jgi:hypothetical protein